MPRRRLAFLLAVSLAMLVGGALCYPFRAAIPHALRGVLADFLWAGALSCALAALASRRMIVAGFVVAELLEIAQLHPAVPGTFDVLDMLAIALGYAMGLGIARTQPATRRATLAK